MLVGSGVVELAMRNTTLMSAPFPGWRRCSVVIPASRVRLSDVYDSLSFERWWAADLQGDDCVQFAEILAVDQLAGADYVPLFMARAFGQVHARHWVSFSGG